MQRRLLAEPLKEREAEVNHTASHLAADVALQQMEERLRAKERELEEVKAGSARSPADVSAVQRLQDLAADVRLQVYRLLADPIC